MAWLFWYVCLSLMECDSMLAPSRGRVLVLEPAQGAVAFSISGLHAGSDSTLLPSQRSSWQGSHVPATKAFLGDESRILPLTCWLETTSSRPVSGEAQRGPRLVLPSSRLPSYAGHWPPTGSYLCVWMGVGRGTRGGQRVAVSSSAAFHYFIIIIFCKFLTQILTQHGVH